MRIHAKKLMATTFFSALEQDNDLTARMGKNELLVSRYEFESAALGSSSRRTSERLRMRRSDGQEDAECSDQILWISEVRADPTRMGRRFPPTLGPAFLSQVFRYCNREV